MIRTKRKFPVHARKCRAAARSELTSATLGSDAHAYAFDNVGNRGAATEAGTQFAYVTNELNQYLGVASSGEATFPRLAAETRTSSPPRVPARTRKHPC